MPVPPALYEAADRARRLVWRVASPRTVGVRGIVVGASGEVLVVRHTYGSARWHLPGGGVKRRESLVAALERELREEAGVAIEGPVRLLGAYSNLTQGRSDHITVFVVDRWRREASDSAEIAGIAFVQPASLPDDLSPGTRRRIEEWSGHAPSRPFEW